MKFTCDDCGAQYMIADEKIGPKGVKVRCKKCANVIILRPQRAGGSLPPSAPRGSTEPPPPADSRGVMPVVSAPVAPAVFTPVKKPPPAPMPSGISAGGSLSLPSEEDEDEATQAFDQRARTSPHTDPSPALGVSSDFGLSEEFAAKGFDPPPERSEPSDAPSPFSSVHLGGSLRDLARSEENPLAAPVGLGVVPRIDEGTGDATTSVDQAPKVSEDFGEVETRVGKVEIPPEARRTEEDDAVDVPLGRALSQAAAAIPDDEEETGKRALANLPPPAPLAPMGHGLTDEPSEKTSRERGVTMPFDGSAFGDELRKELDSSPPSGLGRAGSSGGGGLPLAADSAERAPAPAPVMRAPMAKKSIGPEVQSAVGGNLEEEIGSAFEAVFGNGAGILDGGEKDPFDALVGAAERSLNENGHRGGDDEKKATRVFDTDAMQKLQEEQDLASRSPVAEKPVEEWYVAVNDNQVGPLTIAGVGERFRRGEVDANSLCWKQGMADWIAIRFVRELESIVSTEATDTKVQKVDKPDLSAEPPTRAHVIVAKPKDRAASTLSSLAQSKEKAKPAPEPAEAPADDGSEASWRPSAASALASLAQAELAGAPPAAPVKEVKPNLSLPPPPASAKLPFEPISASMFGAGEQTFTRSGTSLPKAPDLASSVSLREPGSGNRSTGLLLPFAIAGGAVAAVVVVAVVLYFALRQPPPPAVAVTPPVPAQTAAPVAPPSPSVPAGAIAQATPAPDPALAAGGAGTASASPAAAPPTAAPAPASAAPASPVASAAPAGAERPAKDPGRAAKARPPREAPVRSREPEGTVIASAPSPSPKKDRVEMEDLLAEGSRGKAPKAAPAAAPAEDALPEQLDDADVLRILRAHKNDINACRDKQAKEDPNLEGVMTVNFVLLKGGTTSQHTVSPDKFKGSVVAKCVVGSVKGWVFPKFAGRPMPIDFPVTVKGRG